MIYAELQYDQHYSDMHSSIVEFVQSIYESVEHGHQGDSWIWIFDGEAKVAIDTFSSMTHQIKASAADENLARSVIEVLSARFKLDVFPQPAVEPHEDL